MAGFPALKPAFTVRVSHEPSIRSSTDSFLVDMLTQVLRSRLILPILLVGNSYKKIQWPKKFPDIGFAAC